MYNALGVSVLAFMKSYYYAMYSVRYICAYVCGTRTHYVQSIHTIVAVGIGRYIFRSWANWVSGTVWVKSIGLDGSRYGGCLSKAVGGWLWQFPAKSLTGGAQTSIHQHIYIYMYIWVYEHRLVPSHVQQRLCVRICVRINAPT